MDVNLVLFKKDGSHKSFALPSSSTTIGRRHDCDLQIPLANVSRRHCQLNQNSESLKIRDLDSRNGTFVNNQKINGETTLTAGDYLKIGSLVFLLQIDGKPETITPPPAAIAKKADSKVTAPIENLSDDDFLDLEELDIDESSDDDDFLAELEEL